MKVPKILKIVIPIILILLLIIFWRLSVRILAFIVVLPFMILVGFTKLINILGYRFLFLIMIALIAIAIYLARQLSIKKNRFIMKYRWVSIALLNLSILLSCAFMLGLLLGSSIQTQTYYLLEDQILEEKNITFYGQYTDGSSWFTDRGGCYDVAFITRTKSRVVTRDCVPTNFDYYNCTYQGRDISLRRTLTINKDERFQSLFFDTKQSCTLPRPDELRLTTTGAIRTVIVE